MKCVICGCETPGTPGLNNPATTWPLCPPCKASEDAEADKRMGHLVRTLDMVFSPIAAMKREADRRLPVRLAPSLNRQEMRRLAKLTDSELAIEVTARRLLPVLMAESDGRDLDARDGEEPDRAEAYERRCNLQDRYNQ